jgi:putative ABC transport system ATP-binding protein
MKSSKGVLKVSNVSKVYHTGDVLVNALNDVSFEAHTGELVVILGQSGSGKSTLLNLIGGIDTLSSGEIVVDGRNIADFSEKQRTLYRRKYVGFVFQSYNLIPLLTAYENVKLSTDLVKAPKQKGYETIKTLGLEEKLNQYPNQLSGGEQQRVSIARAIIKSPKLLLCDEPTGALDTNNSSKVLTLINDVCHNNDITAVIITHNELISQMADTVIRLKNGQIESIKENNNKLHPNQILW